MSHIPRKIIRNIETISGGKTETKKNNGKRTTLRKKRKMRERERTKGRKKSMKVSEKEKHGPAYYFSCFNATLLFVSKMKKASNLMRQANRIGQFQNIINNKLAKVKIE